ncbi:MAG: DUF2958 domain-containing protein [Actinobacteria bacterium]|uniref:Unannotated protein n=1 Tax=freshwater metagenome TaxID=449393 RepID=A0A6J6MK37_9ZZZZ|nr:DUF2958 domain-containing protein [Actinomycetota bacterium]
MKATYTLKRPSTKTPKLYETENEIEASETLIVAHYFLPGTICDWYVMEFDEENDLIYGFAELISGMGEIGYSSLKEMEELVVMSKMHMLGKVIEFPCHVEFDEHWTPRTLREVLANRG